MNRSIIGLIWCFAFVGLEAAQYVFFGGLFQRMSAYLFGFLVFGLTTLAILAWCAFKAPDQLRAAIRNPRPLIAANLAATLSWCAYLTAVQLIEPAVAYTIGAGVMPLTATLAHRFGVREGEALRNRTEAAGNLLLCCGILFLSMTTIFGWSGFVRGGVGTAILGVCLTIFEGVLFTWLLIYCQRLNRVGVGPTAVFGLRFPLYVFTAGALAIAGADHKLDLPAGEIALMVAIGLVLTIPPLYALQKAVALVSTLTIGALTALGPFLIFGLQMVEGRVEYAAATLAGLCIYFGGATLAALGAVRAASKKVTP